MAKFQMIFAASEALELIQTRFISEEGREYCSIRGKSSGAFHNSGTFQWTSAVRGLACLTINAKMQTISSFDAQLSGGVGSMAASLDYAISKEPTWLCEMFGLQVSGQCFAKRLFRVSNPNRKRAGPVSISINPKILCREEISIEINGCVVEAVDELQRTKHLIEFASGETSLPLACAA